MLLVYIQSWIKISNFLFYRNGKAIDNTAYGPLIDLPDFSYLGMELFVVFSSSEQKDDLRCSDQSLSIVHRHHCHYCHQLLTY